MNGYDTRTSGLSLEFRHELGRLVSHPLREIERLEHQADLGESAATPAILVAGVAIFVWALVAIVLGVVLGAAGLLVS